MRQLKKKRKKQKKKKSPKGTRENSWLFFPFLEEEHAWFEVMWANTPASHYIRMRIMHIATQNKWFLRKVRKPFSKPFISIIMVLSHYFYEEKIGDSILYLTVDVFFEILDYCSQNSRRGGHSWWSGGHRRWRRWLCKDRNMPFIS